MLLTTEQRDALTELINIGFGRAAASLSKLTGHRVQLDVPQVTMCPVAELADALRPYITGEIASVHQVFSGPVAGDALLVLDQRDAQVLEHRSAMTLGPVKPATALAVIHLSLSSRLRAQ